jgi:hypothetical protein
MERHEFSNRLRELAYADTQRRRQFYATGQANLRLGNNLLGLV